jgi:hypothetical protein
MISDKQRLQRDQVIKYALVEQCQAIVSQR